MIAAVALLGVVVAQDPDGEALERFAALRSTQKAMLVARVRARLATEHPEASARIQALQVDLESVPEADAEPMFGGTSRRVIDADQATHRAVAARFARDPLLPDLRTEVAYDWCGGRVVRRETPLDFDEVYANLLAGYAPGSDHAVARVLAELDDHKGVRRLAVWFGHRYADLDGRAFAGVTLYDAWYSGKIVDVPDVDALAFGHEVLGERWMKPPLKGKTRDTVYEAICDCALAYRKYRTTREAAAAAFVRSAPKMDPIYARLVPRFHYLFALHADDVTKVRDLIHDERRDEMIAEIDARVSDPADEAHTLGSTRHQQLAAFEQAVRAVALAELDVATKGR